MHSYSNELGRLSQGIRNIPGTNTIKFIRKDQVPKGRKVTYGRIVVTYHPQKSEPNRSRLTAGGDRLDSPVDPATPTADLTSIKLLWNSVISTPGARYVMMDVKNFLRDEIHLQFHILVIVKGVFKNKFLTSIVTYLEPGVEMT